MYENVTVQRTRSHKEKNNFKKQKNTTSTDGRQGLRMDRDIPKK